MRNECIETDSCCHAQTLGAVQTEYGKEDLDSQLGSQVDPKEREAAREAILKVMTMTGGTLVSAFCSCSICLSSAAVKWWLSVFNSSSLPNVSQLRNLITGQHLCDLAVHINCTD